jgi:dipeptidyl aminopeptidase/acylaminoacyl peptidase
LIFLLHGQSALAQKSLAPLPVEELLSARSFGGQLSAYGDWVAFTLRDPQRAPTLPSTADIFRETGVVWWAVGSDIVIVNSRTGETKNLTYGQGNNWAPVWSPDGRYLAFYSDRTAGKQDKQARLWVWEKVSGRLRQVSNEIIRAFADSEIQWTPDSRKLLVKLLPAGLTTAAFHQMVSPAPTKLEQAEAKNETTVTVYRSQTEPSKTADEPVVGSWSLEPLMADLALIEVANGRVQRLARKIKCARQALSPSGKYLALSSPQRFARAGSQQMLFDLQVIRLADGQMRTVATAVPMNTGTHFRWSPDETRLAWQTGGMTAVSEVFVADIATSSPRLLTNQPHPRFEPYVAQSPLWDAAGKTLYFIGADALWRATLAEPNAVEFVRLPEQRLEMIEDSDGRIWSPDGGRSIVVVARHLKTKQSGFYRIDLGTGQANQLFAGDVIIESTRAATHQHLLYLAQTAHQSPDVWLASADGQTVKRVSRINPQLDQYEMGAARVIEWQTAEGQTLRGALLLPAGYKAGKRYPLIVKLYAGRRISDDLNRFGMSRVFYENAQLLATRGYAVLLPDVPQKLGSPMADIPKAVLPAVDKVIAMGIADAERLGAIGQSYGGYSTLSLIVQTTRFKAAVMSAGYGNLFSRYSQMRRDGSTHGITIMEQGQGLMGGTPWEFRQRYIDNSPFFFLDRVQTPLLILHGTGDDTVKSDGGDEVFVGLRRLGKKVVYARYEGEDHSAVTWRRPNQIDYLKRWLAWFDEHLKPQEAGMK